MRLTRISALVAAAVLTFGFGACTKPPSPPTPTTPPAPTTTAPPPDIVASGVSMRQVLETFRDELQLTYQIEFVRQGDAPVTCSSGQVIASTDALGIFPCSSGRLVVTEAVNEDPLPAMAVWFITGFRVINTRAPRFNTNDEQACAAAFVTVRHNPGGEVELIQHLTNARPSRLVPGLQGIKAARDGQSVEACLG